MLDITPSFAVTLFFRSVLLINIKKLELRSRCTWLAMLLNSSNQPSCCLWFGLILVSMLEVVQARSGALRPMGKDYEKTFIKCLI